MLGLSDKLMVSVPAPSKTPTLSARRRAGGFDSGLLQEFDIMGMQPGELPARKKRKRQAAQTP